MALVGYEIEKRRIESKIQELRRHLKGRGGTIPVIGGDPAPRKRELSDAARKRIANAQKRRWAEHRRRAAQAAKAQRTKRDSAKSQAAKAAGSTST
jgi:hypothetical protein